MVLFGEGYGQKIQKAGKLYLPDAHNFILFDVNIDGWWVSHESVDSIATELGIQAVPVVFMGVLTQAIGMVRGGFASILGTGQAEGLVLLPAVSIHGRQGNRIITKVKTKDYT